MQRRKLSRDVAGLLGTRVAWSLMGMVSGIILARWLAPFDRGVLALVLLVPNTVVTLVKFGVSQANVYSINRRKVSVDQVASNALVLALVLGGGSALIVWVLRGGLLATVLREVPGWALALALVRVPIMLLDNYLFSLLQATGRFATYNIRLLMSESLRLTLVVLALMVFDLGLFAAVVIYTFVGTVNVSWLMLTMRRDIRFSLSLSRPLLRETLAFGARSYVQTVSTHMLLRTGVYMVSAFLGPAQTAFYSMALHFTELVLEIPQAVGMVLYPRLASLRGDEIHRLTAQACRRTLMVTVPAAFGIGWLGPYVIVLWYGQPYAPAGAPLPWAAVGVAMMVIFVIVTRDFTSRAKQGVNIAAGLLALVGNVALNLVMIPAYGIVGAAMAAAISYSGAGVVLVVVFLIESRLSIVDVLIPKGEDWRYFAGLARRGFERGLTLTGMRRAQGPGTRD